MIRKLSGAFTGGAVGALVDSFNIWILGKAGITAMLGVGLRPEFTPSWLYPRMVWGGIWGLVLILPLFKNVRTSVRGMIVSLAPTAMMFFVVFPSMGKGYLGLGFGLLTPVVVLLLNFIWGIVSAYWYRDTL
jgi:hypothetical protein